MKHLIYLEGIFWIIYEEFWDDEDYLKLDREMNFN
jgi:hypothetical protein